MEMEMKLNLYHLVNTTAAAAVAAAEAVVTTASMHIMCLYTSYVYMMIVRERERNDD